MATLSRDSLYGMGALQIPRPKCQGFQFVPTRGRMGFYRSIKRDGEKYGIQMKNMGPRRPQLPTADFFAAPDGAPPSGEMNNNAEIKEERKHSAPQNGTLSRPNHAPTKFPATNPTVKKQPPPAPPLPCDAARLPPRPPPKKTTPAPTRPVMEEPPVDYDDEPRMQKPVQAQVFRRQAPVMSKPAVRNYDDYQFTERF